MDCIIPPAASGTLACTRCGWVVPDEFRPAAEAGTLHRNCPLPEDPALIGRRTARLAVCADCEHLEDEEPPGPYCHRDVERYNLTTCQARGVFRRRLDGQGILPCERWGERKATAVAVAAHPGPRH